MVEAFLIEVSLYYRDSKWGLVVLEKLWLVAPGSESYQLKYFLHVHLLPNLNFFWKLRGTSGYPALIGFLKQIADLKKISTELYFQMFDNY